MPFVAERANASSEIRRLNRERAHLDAEVVEKFPSGAPRIVCLASWHDAQIIVAALNGVGRREMVLGDDALGMPHG